MSCSTLLMLDFISESLIRMSALGLKSQLNDLKNEFERRIEKRKRKLNEVHSSLKIFQVSPGMDFKEM